MFEQMLTSTEIRNEERALPQDQDAADSANAYLLNLRIQVVQGVDPLPQVHLSREHGRMLSDLDFLRRRKFTEEQLARAPDTLAFPNAWKTNLGDFAYNNGALIMSRKAAEVLERLEPDVHQLLPLKVEASKRYKERLEAMGHVLVNVCQTVQSVSIEKSRLKQYISDLPPPHPKAVNYLLDLDTPNRFPDLAIHEAKVSGLHLWGGGDRVLAHELFVSRALKEAWEAAGCGPMAYFPCKTA